MNNNSAVLNCLSKQIFLKFEDKFFIVDLAEGDLEDNWGSIQFSDKTTLDINFSWEDEPSICLYGLTYDAENDVYNVNTKENYPIRIAYIIGNKGDYFDMEYQPEIGVNTFRVYSGSKMIKRTSSLDIASDFAAKSMIVDKLNDIHIVAMDKYGTSKIIEIADKYKIFYQIKEKSKEVTEHFGMTALEIAENKKKYYIK